MLTGIVPKMAIRFTSYEWYKQMLADEQGMVSGRATFLGTSTLPSLPNVDDAWDWKTVTFGSEVGGWRM